MRSPWVTCSVLLCCRLRACSPPGWQLELTSGLPPQSLHFSSEEGFLFHSLSHPELIYAGRPTSIPHPRPPLSIVSCSVSKSCPAICDSMDCSTSGFLDYHYLLGFPKSHVHCVGDTIQPSHPLSPPFSSCPQSFPASGSFPVSQLFTSCGHSIGASASAPDRPMNIQD